jgi:hypothetical protein
MGIQRTDDVNYDKLRETHNLSLILAVAAATCLLGLEHDRLVTYLLSGSTEGYLAIAVLAASVFWLLDMEQATKAEIGLFSKYRILERINIDWQENTTAVVVSLCFGGLIASVVYPVIFCVLAVTIQVGDCIGVWMIQKAFFEVSQVPEGLSPTLSEYYFYKPHSVHRVLKVVGFMAALVFSALAAYTHRPAFGIISWIIVLVTIIGGEGVLMRWRHWLRDRQKHEGSISRT